MANQFDPNAIKWDAAPSSAAPADSIRWDEPARSEGAGEAFLRDANVATSNTLGFLGSLLQPVGDAVEWAEAKLTGREPRYSTFASDRYGDARAMREGAGERDVGATLAGAAGTMAIDLPQMLLGGAQRGGAQALTSAAEMAPSWLQAGRRALDDGVRASAVVAPRYGVDTANQVQWDGGSVGEALTAGAMETLAAPVVNALPIGVAGHWLSRAGQGAASNVVADATQNSLVNLALPDNMQRDITDPKQMLVSAAAGAPMGVAFGQRAQPAPSRAGGGVLNSVLNGDGASAPTNRMTPADLSAFADRRLREFADLPNPSARERSDFEYLRSVRNDPAALAEALGIELDTSTPLALPPPTRPVLSVDSKGVAMTAEDRLGLGLTPDIIRSQSVRWDDAARNDAAVAEKPAAQPSVEPQQLGLGPLLALPPPTREPITVDSRGVAETPEQRAASTAQRAASVAQQRDLGITPDIERTQRQRWDQQRRAQEANAVDQRAMDDYRAEDDDVAAQRNDDAPEWWMAAQAEADATGGRVAGEDASAPAPRVAVDPDARAAADFEQRLGGLGDDLTPEQVSRLRDTLRPTLPRDRVTGLHRSEELRATLDAAHAAATPAVYVEADLTNLGGLNAKLGNSGADAYLRKMADAIRAELEPLGATVGVRKGGDEFGFVVQNGDAEAVDAAMMRARDAFAQVVAADGLADVPHTKAGRDGGAGLHFGVGEILSGVDISATVARADQLVERRKKGEDYGFRGTAETSGLGSPAGRGTDGGAPETGPDVRRSGGESEAGARGAPLATEPAADGAAQAVAAASTAVESQGAPAPATQGVRDEAAEAGGTHPRGGDGRIDDGAILGGASGEPSARSADSNPGPAPDANEGAQGGLSAASRPYFEALSGEIGWAERGGRMIRDGEIEQDGLQVRASGSVVGRTPWLGKPDHAGRESDFWRNRPDQSLSETAARRVLEKHAAGKKLAPREQRFLDHAIATADRYAAEAAVENAAHRQHLAQIEEDARADAIAALRDDGADIPDADAGEALSLAELVDRAVDSGIDPLDVVAATGGFAEMSPQQQAAALWRMIREQEASHGIDTATGAGRDSGRSETTGRGQAAAQDQHAGREAGGSEGLTLDDAQFARASDASARGIPVEEAARIANEFKTSYRGNIPLVFRVVNSLEEVYGPGATERVGRSRGSYHPKSGIFVLAAANLRDGRDATETLRHEILAHYGLNTLAPADKRALLEKVGSTQPGKGATSSGMRKLWAYIEQRYGDANPLLQAEEVFALAAERQGGVLGKVWDDVVSSVIAALRKVGIVRGAITVPEIRSTVEAIGRGIRRGEGQKTFPESDSAQFARAAAAHLSPAQVGAMGKIGAGTAPSTLAASIARITDRARLKLAQGLVDQFAPLRNLDMTAYMQARLSKGTDGALEAVFLRGKPVLRDGAFDVQVDGKGLQGILSDLSGEHEQFLAWIAGNRAEALSNEWEVEFGDGTVQRYKTEADARSAAAGLNGAKPRAASRERLFTDADIKALKSLNQGKMANGRDRSIAFAKAHREFRAYQKAVLDIAEEAGLIEPVSRATWESEFYIPFYRVMEDEKAGTFKPAGAAQLVRQQAIRELRGGREELQDLLNNTLQNWSHLLTASMRNMSADKALAAAEKAKVATKLTAAEKGSVWVQRKGQQVHYRVDDELVFDALVALDFTGLKGGAMDAMRKMKHALTVGVTISPTFRIRNLMRDTISALGTSDHAGWNPLRNLVDGWKGTKHGSAIDAKLLAGGGKVRFGTMLDGEAQTAKRLIKMGVKDADILDTGEKIAGALRSMWDWWDRTGDRAETVNRSAIYQNAIKAGKTHLEASYEARDLMDFTMAGKWTAVRFLTSVVPFMNARAQGLYKLGRAAGGNPVRFAAVTGAVAMASALNYLLHRDDEEFQALPDWARDTYWPIKIGDKFVYIPKPFEIGSLGTVVERGTELMLGGDDYQARDFAGTLGGLLFNTLSMNPIPQAAKPMVEAFFNEDPFRGQDIDSMGDMAMLASDRYDASTSAGAVAASRATTAVGSVIGKDGVSPKRIEHMVRGYFGWLGTQALNVSDLMLRDAMDLSSNPRRDLTKIDNVLVLGDLVKDAEGGSTKYLQRFYDTQRSIEQVYRSWRAASKGGDEDRAAELEGRPEMEQRPTFARAKRQMDKINQQIRQVRSDRSLSAQEKRLELEALYEQRNDLARDTDREARAQAAE